MNSHLNQQARNSDYLSTDSKPLTDIELFERIAVGDEEALNELYGRYRDQVYRFLIHRTGDKVAAEELLQEVFMAAWNGAEKFRGEAAVKTWLLRVAYYRAANWVKSIKKHIDLAQVEDILGSETQMIDRVIQDRQADDVTEALSHLSKNHRTAIELLFYHDLTYKEAARVMGCPEGTMKSRVNHALKNLSGILIRADLE